MVDYVYRGNLSASQFPLVASYQGRSVVIPGPDQNYIRGLQAPEGQLINENDKGIPQIAYAHNVMPSPEGFQSVTLTQQVAAGIGPPTDLSILYPVNDMPPAGGPIPVPVYIAYSRILGTMMRLEQIAGVWTWSAVTVTGGLTPTLANTISITSAMVNGVTYFLLNPVSTAFAWADQCRTWLWNTNTFGAAPLVGTATAFGALRIRGNASCFGYHILWNENVIAWSSTTNPLDFTPSLVSGAGFGSIEGARGAVVAVVPHQLGLIIYTTANAVAAIYTGNARYPFQFKEITGVGGMPDYIPSGSLDGAQEVISNDPNTNSQYAYTSSGLQQLGINAIINVLPDITNFIAGRTFEDFNTTTHLFTRTAITTPMWKKINTVADRYLIISYGVASAGIEPVFTHALIYDIITKRLGKIKFTHTYAFPLLNTAAVSLALPAVSTGARYQIAFMTGAGVVATVNFDTNASTLSDSVIMLGKFQHIRDNLISIEQLELENVVNVTFTDIWMYSPIDGKTGIFSTSVIPDHYTNTKVAGGDLGAWYMHKTAMNHTIVIIGSFYLTSILLTYHIASKR